MSTVDEDVAAKAKAEREAAESAARKAAHEESTAKLADEKAAAELAEWRLNAADRKRTADQAAETTRLDNLTKLQTVVGNAVPELKGLARGETTAPDDVLYSTFLTVDALTKAANLVVKAVKGTDRNAYRIFVTSDPDLLSRDAQLRSMMSRLTALTAVVKGFPDPAGVGGLEGGLIVTAASAAAKLIPGILELFAANRKLTAKSVTIEEEQAVTAVAGALAASEGEDVLMFDDTRFLRGDTDVEKARNALEAATIELQGKLAEEKAKATEKQDAAWLAEAPTVVTAAQEALAALDTVPTGATLSPLSAAMAIELIRESNMDFILVVRPAGGSATQLLSDRPLAMKDPIYIAGSVALSYRLIKRDTSQIAAAGVVVGSAQLRGTVGSTIDLD